MVATICANVGEQMREWSPSIARFLSSFQGKHIMKTFSPHAVFCSRESRESRENIHCCRSYVAVRKANASETMRFSRDSRDSREIFIFNWEKNKVVHSRKIIMRFPWPKGSCYLLAATIRANGRVLSRGWWRPFVRMVAINNREVQLEIIGTTRRFYFIKPSSLCGGGGIDIGIFML